MDDFKKAIEFLKENKVKVVFEENQVHLLGEKQSIVLSKHGIWWINEIPKK